MAHRHGKMKEVLQRKIRWFFEHSLGFVIYQSCRKNIIAAEVAVAFVKNFTWFPCIILRRKHDCGYFLIMERNSFREYSLAKACSRSRHPGTHDKKPLLDRYFQRFPVPCHLQIRRLRFQGYNRIEEQFPSQLHLSRKRLKR